MTPISLDFSRRTELSVEAQAIAAVSTLAWTLEIPMLIVGAFARDLHIRHRFGKATGRVTEDIDLALAVPDWPAFHTLRERLIASGQFNARRHVLHSLRHISGLAFDLVPFSGVENLERHIAWPPGGEIVMDVFGFREVQTSAHEITLPGDVRVRVISLQALTLLKLLAWKARHYTAPAKDAHDLMLVVGDYLALGNEERLWNEFIDWTADDSFDYEAAGARMLGRDIRALLDQRGAERVGALLATETDIASPGTLANAMRPADPDKARTLLTHLYHGVMEV